MSFPWLGVKQPCSCSHLRLVASARIRAATNLTGPGREPLSGGERLGAQITKALDEITGEAISTVGDLVASATTGPAARAVRGIEAAAW